MRYQVSLLAISFLLMLGATSCREDYFDPEAYNERVQAAFPVKNVDPAHTWSTVGQAYVRISVNKKAGETFKIRLYDQDPLEKPEGLVILCSGQVKDGETFTSTFNYGQATDVVYVALFDSRGYMSVYPQGIIDSKVELQIGGGESASRSERYKVQKKYGYDFPDTPAASDYKDDKPEGTSHLNSYQASADEWYIDESNTGQSVQLNGVWNVDHYGSIYVVSNGGGGIVAPSYFYFQSGYQDWSNGGAIMDASRRPKLYICPGATLRLTANDSGNLQAGLIVYVAAGGRLEAEGELKLNTVFIYNKGTIAAPSLSANGDGMLYNQGTVTIEGDMKVTNANSTIVNEGTLSAVNYGSEGSGNFWNTGSVTFTGTSTINSNGNVWVNEGEYTTYNYTYTAGSVYVINKCHLTVQNLFYLGLGETAKNSFQLDAGASVETVDFQFSGPGYIYMGEGSLFKVTGNAYMGITKDTYGIYGPSTGGYAVFQANNIQRGSSTMYVDPNQGFVANYFGHLYVACNSHFNFGYSDKSAEQQAAGEVGAQPYYRLDAASGAQKVGYNEADVHITDNGCGAAYNGEPQEAEPVAESLSYRYCYEDNFPEPGDYDFNDVVMTVTPTLNGTSTVVLQVSLDAVGASEQIAAALRIKGLTPSDVISCTRDVDLDEGLPYSSTSRIIKTDEVMLPSEMKTTQARNDVVLPLFNNAHWTLGHQFASDGSVDNSFINTVPTSNGYEPKRNGVAPAVVTFTFELSSAEKASYFVQSFIDPFIVQGYNGGYWEVHPVPYKYDEVIAEYYKDLRADYDDSDKKPWAICVAGSNFKYPIEWKPINEAYNTPGHSFSEWATDRTQATDWYLYPTAEMVYE